GGGSVILIASQLGRVGAAGRPAYCATKGALIQLAKVLAADHAGQGIRANTISPGAVETRRMLMRHKNMDEARTMMGPKHLLNRLGRPEEIARAAVYLASDASSFMTGRDRLINDAYAELARKHPGRFNAVVSLPMPHIDASLREMERGLDQLGMLGVSMTCSCFDRSTAEAEFEPLYQEMNRRRAVLNYHPIQNGICSPMINDYGFTVSVGASLEDAAIVLHLIARRVPERFLNIKYVVPHLGGIIPMLLQRLDNQAPRQHPNLPERPSVTARR